MLGICWEKYIFDVGKKNLKKNDPKWVKVGQRKYNYEKVGTILFPKYCLSDFIF